MLASLSPLSPHPQPRRRVQFVRELDGGIALIPEPETYAMLLAGLALLAFATRRRGRQQAS